MGHMEPLVDSHNSIVALSNVRPDVFARTGSFITWPLMAQTNSGGMPDLEGSLKFDVAVEDVAEDNSFLMGFPFDSPGNSRERATLICSLSWRADKEGRSPRRR